MFLHFPIKTSRLLLGTSSPHFLKYDVKQLRTQIPHYRLENHFHFFIFFISLLKILVILSFPQIFSSLYEKIFSIFCDLIFIFHLGASPSDSNKWTHFQKCIQFRRSRALLPLLSLQISKYYNHYQIGEFPLLVFAQRYQTKSFITFESKMSLPFLSTLFVNRRNLLGYDLYL